MTEQIKTSIDSIKERIKQGHYNSLTGALKAVGRVSGWKEKEREEVRAYARSYFAKNGGAEETAAAPKKVAKKVAKKTAPEKAAAAPKATAKKTRRARVEDTSATETLTREKADSFSRVDQATASVQNTLNTLEKTISLGGDPAKAALVAAEAQFALSRCITRIVDILENRKPDAQEESLRKIAAASGVVVAPPQPNGTPPQLAPTTFVVPPFTPTPQA